MDNTLESFGTSKTRLDEGAKNPTESYITWMHLPLVLMIKTDGMDNILESFGTSKTR